MSLCLTHTLVLCRIGTILYRKSLLYAHYHLCLLRTTKYIYIYFLLLVVVPLSSWIVELSPRTSVAYHQCCSSQIFAAPLQDVIDPPARSSRLVITVDIPKTLQQTIMHPADVTKELELSVSDCGYDCFLLLDSHSYVFVSSVILPLYCHFTVIRN